MDYATILVHIDASAQLHQRLHIAAQLAVVHGAKLIGLFAVDDADCQAARHVFAGGESRGAVASWRHNAVENSRAAFRAATRGLEIEAEWRECELCMPHAVVVNGHLADLLVLQQPDPLDKAVAEKYRLVDAMVLRGGRPVIIVPHSGWFPHTGSTIMVAWNGSRESAHAIRDALPLLKRAASVDVIRFLGPRALENPWFVPAQYVTTWLKRHGVVCELEETALDNHDEIGQLLLSRLAERNIDLLVMGAYGTGRAFELVLGGVTRTIMRSSQIPVLMSH